MDLETQQEQLEEANKLNNILISIEKQNSLLNELSKNSQKSKPLNTITLEKPDLDIKSKDTESKQIEKPEKQEVNFSIKEEIKSNELNQENNEEAKLDEEEKINNLENNQEDDLTKKPVKIPVEINDLENNQKEDLTKIPAKVPYSIKSTAIDQKIPDWFNTVKEQLNDLISNSNINVEDEIVEENIKENISAEQEKEEMPEPIKKEENFKNLENLEKNDVQEKLVDNLNNQPAISEIKLNKNTSVITEKIIEKSDNNRQEIENLKEESNLEIPTEKENIDNIKIEEEVKPQISITLKNNTINKKIKDEISDIESSEPIEELPVVEDKDTLEIDSADNNKDNNIKEESLNNILENNPVENRNQENNKNIDLEQSTPQEASFTTEEISETPIDSNNSLESLVSEISKQLSQLTNNNDKNFLNIANIMMGINNTLRSMNNNLNNIVNNNVFVNEESSSSIGKSTDNFNESNLQRYRQQIRNSDMINEVATRVLRHSIPGVTL
jgi:hypothetical protein